MVLCRREIEPLHYHSANGIWRSNIPAGSIITLRPDAKPDSVQLSDDTHIAGIICRGGSWLGPAGGSTTEFYPSGKLRQCFLAGNQEVQGVPCMNGGLVGDRQGHAAQFSEDGTLNPAS